MIQWMSGFIFRSVNGVEQVIAEFDPRTEQFIASCKDYLTQMTLSMDYSAQCSYLWINDVGFAISKLRCKL